MASHMTKDDARAEAKLVRELMRNPGVWKIRVWENIGWYWSLQCRNVTVSSCRDLGQNTYFALVGTEDGDTSGLGAWFSRDGVRGNPQDAVDVAIKAAADYVDELRSAVEMAGEAG
jgi:hypothetical protein